MAFKDYFKTFQSLQVNEKLLLRQVRPESDLDAYFEIYADTDAFRYYGGGGKVLNRETVLRILNNQIKEFTTARVYSWTIVDAKTDKALGRIFLSDFAYNNKVANIGYFLGRDSWGKGIATACAEAVAAFGFSQLALERIYTTVHPDNTPSWKVLEKNGFRREGHLRHCFETAEGLTDCYMYAKLVWDESEQEA